MVSHCGKKWSYIRLYKRFWVRLADGVMPCTIYFHFSQFVCVFFLRSGFRGARISMNPNWHCSDERTKERKTAIPETIQSNKNKKQKNMICHA